MGATVTYRVRVLRLVEDEVEVSAITPSDAEDKALGMRGVSRVLGVMPDLATSPAPASAADTGHPSP